MVQSPWQGFHVQVVTGKRGAGSGLPHRGILFGSVSSGGGITQSSGNLAVLDQVEGGDLLGLLDLLLVALDLALQLVDQPLHALVVLLVLVTGEGKLLDGPLGLAEVLKDVGVAPALGVQLGLQLADAGLHLDHGLPAALQGVDLGLVGAGAGVLALGLQQLLVLLQRHGQLLLAAELVSQAGGVHHGAGGLLLGHPRLVGHLVQVALQLVVLGLQLPPGGGDGLVDVAEVGHVLVGVGELLHGGGSPVRSNLVVSGSGLGLGLGVHLGLGVPDLQLVLLDGLLGLRVAGDGVLQSQAEVSRVSLQLLLHPQSLGLALGLGLQGGLHGVQTLVLVLPDHGELLVLLGDAALDLGLDLGELHLAPQHLVLLLLQGGLGLLQRGLELHLLSLQPLADFVNLVDGAASLSVLVHDVLDLIRQGLVLPPDLLQLEDGLLIGGLDLEQLRGGVPGLLLAHIQVEGQAVALALELRDGLVELLGLPLHGGIDNLGLVEVGGHLGDLLLDLALGLVNLGELGIEVINGGLSLGVPGSQLHLDHLQLLGLLHGVLLVLLAHGGSVTLSLGVQPEDVVTASGLLIQSLLGHIDLVLQVPELAQQQLSLPGLVVAESLGVIQLSGQSSLGLSQHVEAVLQVSNNAEQLSILIGNLVLGHGKVSKSEVGSINLLVDRVQLLNQGLVGLVSRGLAPHDLLGGSSGIIDLSHDGLLVLLNLGLHLLESIDLLLHLQSGVALLPLQVAEDRLGGDVGLLHILAQLDDLALALLVELHLGHGGTAGLIVPVTELLDLTGEVRPLALGLGAGLALGLQLLLSALDTGLQLLDVLLGLGNQRLLVIQLGREHVDILLLGSNDVLNVIPLPLKIIDSVLGHLQVSLNLPLLLLKVGSGLLLLVKSSLQLVMGGLELRLDLVQVSNLLLGSDQILSRLGLGGGQMLLLLVELVDDLVLLSNLVLEHLDGVVTVALLLLHLGDGKLHILNVLLDSSDAA